MDWMGWEKSVGGSCSQRWRVRYACRGVGKTNVRVMVSIEVWGGRERGASVCLFTVMVHPVCMSVDRQGERAGYLNHLHDHRSFVHELGRWKKGGPLALTLGGGAFGMHASG